MDGEGSVVGIGLLVEGVAVGVVPLLEDIRQMYLHSCCRSLLARPPLQMQLPFNMFFHRTCHSSVVVGDDADDMIVLKHIQYI